VSYLVKARITLNVNVHGNIVSTATKTPGISVTDIGWLTLARPKEPFYSVKLAVHKRDVTTELNAYEF
jgi:hypothetical protein